MASWLAVMLTISGLTWLYYECMIRLLIPWAQLGDQYYLLYYLFMCAVKSQPAYIIIPVVVVVVCDLGFFSPSMFLLRLLLTDY